MKNRNILLTAIIIFIISIAGCQKNEQQTQNQEKTVNMTDIEPPPGTDYGKTSAPKDNLRRDEFKNSSNITGDNQPVNYHQQEQNYNTQDKRMIIRSGTMSLEVDKYDETEAKIKQIVSNFSGYVTNSNSLLNTNGKKQGTITVRVASDKFDAVVAELSKTGKVMNQNITGNDVTEEYMDSEARMKTQQELESRLLKLLQEKTASLTNVVEVEQKLAAVRENIERTQGRMKYLKDQASYSTLAVSVYEPSLLQTSTGGGFFYELGQSVKKGLNGFTAVLSGIITFVIALMPVLFVIAFIAYFVRRYLKKRKLAHS
jgi:hypothetical protein